MKFYVVPFIKYSCFNVNYNNMEKEIHLLYNHLLYNLIYYEINIETFELSYYGISFSDRFSRYTACCTRVSCKYSI